MMRTCKIIVVFSCICLFILSMSNCGKSRSANLDSKNLFSLIVIPEQLKDTTLLNHEYTDRWTPYPVLRLDSMTLQQIEEIYGKPSKLFMDTFLYGRSKNGEFGEVRLDTMLSQIPSVEIYQGLWYLQNTVLKLYFIHDRDEKRVFYGYKYNPYEVMFE